MLCYMVLLCAFCWCFLLADSRILIQGGLNAQLKESYAIVHTVSSSKGVVETAGMVGNLNAYSDVMLCYSP
jgi:hypothetical protein